MSIFDDAIAELFTDVHAEAGVSVMYHRFGRASAELVAIKGQSDSERIGEEFSYATSQSDDFLIRIADLEAAGLGEPELGDRIEFTTQGGQTILFAVGVDGFERHFAVESGFRHWFRIHTTEVGTT